MLDVEQKFDVVLANLFDFERELASRTLQAAFYSGHSAGEMLEDRLALNRVVANLLSAARAYIDQVQHHHKVFFPADTTAQAEFQKLFRAEYDGNLAYRVMEALRNYAQHRSLPLHGFTQTNSWVDMGTEERRMVSNMTINVEPAILAEDRSFKASVLRELQELGETIDIKGFVRQYVEALGRVHLAFRAATQQRIADGRAYLSQKRQDFLSLESKEKAIGLALVDEDERGTYKVIEHYPELAIEYLDTIQRRSSALANLSRRVISTDVVKPSS